MATTHGATAGLLTAGKTPPGGGIDSDPAVAIFDPLQMRTILNFGIEPADHSSGAPAAVQTAPSIPAETAPLFQSVVAARPAGAPGRWARSLAVAVSLHAVLIAGFAFAATTLEPAPQPSEPEVVFYAFPPPPPPPPAAAVTVAKKVQARRVPRPEPVIPRQVQRLEEKPVEAPKEEEPVEEEAPAVTEPEGVAGGVVGGVAGGVQGGVTGGSVGGMVGATVHGPLKLSQVSQAPKVVRAVKPDYPRAAKLAGTEGLVVVQVVIGTDGAVEKDRIRIIRSVPGLDGAAIAAVSQYRFTPALGRDGRPARVIVNLPLQFNLR